jgi:hypothetical protein
VFIPYDFQSLPQYADSTYCIEWEPTPDFHPKTGHIVDNELRDGEPIATLIAGRYGSWTKFINHRDDGMHNVEFIFVPIGGKMRLVLQAVRNIRAGEELVTTYGNQYFVRRSTRKRKRRRLSI